MSTSTALRVYETSYQFRARTERGHAKPGHWVDTKPSAFQNPWPSFHPNGFIDGLHLAMSWRSPQVPGNLASLIPVREPTFGLQGKQSSLDNMTKIKATWLGHACFLVELPVRSSPQLNRGARILFDPVFSDRCSPSQLIGPKRFTPAPCAIEQIPDIDIIVISHNHYDHLDTHTIRTLFHRTPMPHIFAPLGNAAYFHSLGVPETHTHIMDWWESRRVETEIPISGTIASEQGLRKVAFDVTCTPAQHFTGRGILDRFKSLWASWVIEEIIDSPSKETDSTPTGVKVFFAGDTGYRAVLNGQDENKVPTCPAFKEIGEKFNGFDFAMIPIGAYQPRSFMSPIHCAPQDSVLLFNDIQAKRALGMHWGTWILTTEDIVEPPKRLAEECEKIGIEKDAFSVCDIGETVLF